MSKESMQLEIQLTRVDRDIKLVSKHLLWMDELSEVKYINQFSIADGITKAKAMMFDLTTQKATLNAEMLKLVHKHDYSIFVAQTTVAKNGDYVQTMQCKYCDRTANFDLNLYS